MKRIRFGLQEPQPIDEATKAALELARDEEQRGEIVTLAEAAELVRKEYQARRVRSYANRVPGP